MKFHVYFPSGMSALHKWGWFTERYPEWLWNIRQGERLKGHDGLTQWHYWWWI